MLLRRWKNAKELFLYGRLSLHLCWTVGWYYWWISRLLPIQMPDFSSWVELLYCLLCLLFRGQFHFRIFCWMLCMKWW